MAKRTSTGNPYYHGPESDHFDGIRFFNPGGRAPGGLRDLLRWRLNGVRAKWPAAWPSPYPPAVPDQRLDGTALRLTMVGHSTMLIQTGGANILTDPVWSARVSPVRFAGPRRVSDPGIRFEDLPPIDVVLLSHNHYDHLDAQTLRRLGREHAPLVITPLGNDRLVAPLSPRLRVETRDWGERVDVAGSITVHIEPAHHWSARGTRDRLMALWSGFVVETPGGRIFFAGDTGFHGGLNYRRLAERHGGFRLAILPIGAYEPRWFMEPHHQNPEEAVEAMEICNASYAAGCHWGTIQLTDEPIEEPRQRLLAALDRKGIPRERFRPMLAGEVWDVPLSTV
ncbi:MAG TPA: MBL fold metallo-hydrolase [Rhizobiales bacterium]|nr:MBL fold metallo-hydrolase [Hyphomicrobiales bacterium]